MKTCADVTLIIATYNWSEALSFVIESVYKQTVKPVEIIIADDGSNDDTKYAIAHHQRKSSIPIKHLWHEDIGFRKTIILNKAVRSAKGSYIIQIDGDIVLHPRFIEDHVKEAAPGFYIRGSRAMLTAQKTNLILGGGNTALTPLGFGVKNKLNASYSPFLSGFFSTNGFRSDNLKGCNFSFWKKDFLAVNGYNTDMQGWGHEDIELAARLTNFGIKQRKLRLKAVCYHLHHKINSRYNESANYKKYLDVIKHKIIKCRTGVELLAVPE